VAHSQPASPAGRNFRALSYGGSGCSPPPSRRTHCGFFFQPHVSLYSPFLLSSFVVRRLETAPLFLQRRGSGSGQPHYSAICLRAPALSFLLRTGLCERWRQSASQLRAGLFFCPASSLDAPQEVVTPQHHLGMCH